MKITRVRPWIVQGPPEETGSRDPSGNPRRATYVFVQVVGKRIALALKTAYGCDGTSFRQHNEPHGDQEVWHYHLHVFPRWHGDDLYGSPHRLTTPEERAPYAERLRRSLRSWPATSGT